ncbi:MAG: methyltransferase domain-containing protein [Mycolicibacterium sp.]|uniref:methyltransferase n=1 Tax=Mycolicibacterium sp. TaxID=2320850 RepID=UPI000FC3C5FE|nr:methyltransferase [Mycolicibacterium sp.]RUP33826.1 MAG: methyltransferase domain-containing protein [Mycolicibacterium sp.]
MLSSEILPECANVYLPQYDSRLLIETMRRCCPPAGMRVADLCTGSGVAAIAAADAGADTVVAFDTSRSAITAARANARLAGCLIDARIGSWSAAVELEPFDLVLCNPPYVPEPANREPVIVGAGGPPASFNAGPDGRLILDPLCAAAPALLRRGGTALIVQSEFADVASTVTALQDGGLQVDVVARRTIPFGPVMTARALWLEDTGRLAPGRRTEELAVIRAVQP